MDIIDNDRLSSHEDHTMVPVRLGAIGNATHTPERLVVVLSPIECDKYVSPQEKVLVYPIEVPESLAPAFIAKIKEIGSQMPELPVISQFFELISDTKLKALYIYNGRFSILPYLVFATSSGEMNRFKVPLVQGLLTALDHKLDMYVDYDLLQEAGNFVEYRGGDDSSKEQKATTDEKAISTLKRDITDGIKPDDPAVAQHLFALRHLDAQAINELLEVALQSENYEWILVLKRGKNE